MSTIITFSIITTLVGIASSVATYLIWDADAKEICTKFAARHAEDLEYIKQLQSENKRLLENSQRLELELANIRIRSNPAQGDFYDMPTKKEYRNKANELFGEW